MHASLLSGTTAIPTLTFQVAPHTSWHAGQFKCEKCGDHSLAAFQYFLLLVGIVCINVFLIWRCLQDLDDVTSWDMPQGSDYVQVTVVNDKLLLMMLLLLEVVADAVAGSCCRRCCQCSSFMLVLMK